MSYTIESIKNYMYDINEFKNVAEKVYEITDFINVDYPKHKEWYWNKQVPGVLSEERDILFIRIDGNVVGVSFLKNTKAEKKICTLYVKEECRGMKMGTNLIEESIQMLGTEKPVITIADYKLDMFTTVIEKYGWELTEVVEGYYNETSKELVYNGGLIVEGEKSIYDDEKDVIDMNDEY